MIWRIWREDLVLNAKITDHIIQQHVLLIDPWWRSRCC